MRPSEGHVASSILAGRASSICAWAPDWCSPGASQHFDPYRFGEVLNLSLPELLHRQLAPAADFLKFTGHLDDLLAQLLATPLVDELVRLLTPAREALSGAVIVRF
jgi:hypothetical protein